MNYFSYVVEHDYGLAPNPFGGICTLSVCKPAIRKNKYLQVGDWVIGTGSKKLGRKNHLIYAMRVEEILTFEEYWSDQRFQYKKPLTNGSLVQMYGDNFYHRDTNTGEWIQELSAHSTINKEKHIKNDTSANAVLISKYFFYLGDNSIMIPDLYIDVCKKGPGMKYKGLAEIGAGFVKWIIENFNAGVSGDPINWIEYKEEHNQTILQI